MADEDHRASEDIANPPGDRCRVVHETERPGRVRRTTGAWQLEQVRAGLVTDQIARRAQVA
jgi:hypothetical protein